MSGNYIVTNTGNIFSYENIENNNINIEDILHSLPRINRFVGHSIRPYSVGEHTLLCYYMAKEKGYSTREQLLTFIHDFAEAYVGDCPAPLKKMLPEFRNIEEKVELEIYKYLGIKPPTKEEIQLVKSIDITMLLIEMKYLTLHEYKNYDIFDNADIYEEFLIDSKFKISDEPNPYQYSELIYKRLKEEFDNLLKKYREE